MCHCNVLIVDDFLVSVGSTNFDNRSFRLNDEANLNIYDRRFTREQVGILDDDLAHSRRVTQEQWRERPWRKRLWEHTMALARLQL